MYSDSVTWLTLTFICLTFVSRCTGYSCVRLRNAPGRCYIVNTKPATWPVALSNCVNQHDGRLAVLETTPELVALQEHLKKSGASKSYFVGAITVDDHKSWMWYPDGQPLQADDWEAGQPDNDGGRGENCAALDFRSGSGGHLADFPCWERHLYVCEVETPDYRDYNMRDYIEERSNEWPWG